MSSQKAVFLTKEFDIIMRFILFYWNKWIFMIYLHVWKKFWELRKFFSLFFRDCKGVKSQFMHFIYYWFNLQIYITSLCMFQVIYIITQSGTINMFHQVTNCMLLRMREADAPSVVHVWFSLVTASVKATYRAKWRLLFIVYSPGMVSPCIYIYASSY